MNSLTVFTEFLLMDVPGSQELQVLQEVEFAFLVVTSFDCCVVICHPLHYRVMITLNLSSQATAGSWASGLLYSAVHTGCMFRLPFTKINVIQQYFCDVPQILRISSSDIQFSEFVIIARYTHGEKVDIYNATTLTQFILIRLSDLPKVHYSLFVAFASIFQVTLVGNGAILLAIKTEAKLHTPMYFFLANLSLLDIFCPSTTVPKMLPNLLTEDHSISFVGCALQLYFLVALAGTEVFLLAVMAYDQYVAICFALCYSVIITKAHCAQLVSETWAAGFLDSTIHTMSTFSLYFCKSNLVNQYYCDIPPVVALSCSSTYVTEMLVLVVGGISGFICFLITLISYVYIISTILKIQSEEGKCKTFSTCASHLLVVCLFYGTVIFTYIQPSSIRHSPARDRLISMLFGVITQCSTWSSTA
ncbi:Olfactory receptor 5V1 [Heterocephalus glaber]|uniref:Olfactory receptor 5V1 n=1 Tax=Heterocephalus glaber TaxID=10181 RepID=G5BIY5_HETGA|nr:Olfactory receptor 5V1 [Heterocephalus glaber]